MQTQYKGFSSLVFILRVSALHYCDADAATTGPTAERVRSYLHHLDNAHSIYMSRGHGECDACHAGDPVEGNIVMASATHVDLTLVCVLLGRVKSSVYS